MTSPMRTGAETRSSRMVSMASLCRARGMGEQVRTGTRYGFHGVLVQGAGNGGAGAHGDKALVSAIDHNRRGQNAHRAHDFLLGEALAARAPVAMYARDARDSVPVSLHAYREQAFGWAGRAVERLSARHGTSRFFHGVDGYGQGLARFHGGEP